MPASLAAPALQIKHRQLRLVTRFEDDLSGNGDLVRRFAARITAASDGAWRIKVEASNDTGLDLVMNGAADFYIGLESDHWAAHPAFHYFAGLPCGVGLVPAAFDAWLQAGGGQELWDELSGLFDIKALAVGSTGPSLGIFCNRAIRARADLKGLRLSVEGLAREVAIACGASMPGPPRRALADTLDGRLLDGVEVLHGDFPFSDRDAQMRLHHGLHQMHPGLNRQGLAIALGMRRSFWDQLPNSERIMLTALAAEASVLARGELLAHQVMAEQMAPMSPHHSVRLPHTAELARDLESIAATVVAEMAGRDRYTRRIDASYMAFRTRAPGQAVA